MTRRTTLIALGALCAFLVGAQTAAAATSGTRAFKCSYTWPLPLGDFSDSHCTQKAGDRFYVHTQTAINKTTNLHANSAVGTTKLKATLGGVATTLTSTELTGTGTMENKVAESKEHFAHGTGTIVYKNVTVSPFTKCFVYTDNGTGTPGAQGVVDTEKLTATTQGQGGALKFTPEAGEVFAKFWILDAAKKGAGGECAIHGTYTVSGSVKATPEGATAATTHAGTTEQNTLKMGQGETSIKAGIEGSLTLEGDDPEEFEDAWAPLGFTTVTT